MITGSELSDGRKLAKDDEGKKRQHLDCDGPNTYIPKQSHTTTATASMVTSTNVEIFTLRPILFGEDHYYFDSDTHPP